MPTTSRLWAVPMLMTAGLLLAGCTQQGADAPAKPSGTQAAHDDHAHHHHDHDEGPNGGHLIELKGGLHAEWLHDDEKRTVTFIILGEDSKTEHPIAADKLTVNSSFEGAKRTFEIPAVGEATDGKNARFETSNVELQGALTSAEKFENTLVIPWDGESIQVTIEHHDHHHHH